MNETKNSWLLIIFGVVGATLIGRLFYEICGNQHVDVVRSLFIGAIVTCTMLQFEKKIAPIAPGYLGLGGVIGDVLTQMTGLH